MEDDARELIRQLFASMSARLENAHDLSVGDQAKSLEVQQQVDLANRLDLAVSQIAALADALIVLTDQPDDAIAASSRVEESPER